MLAKSFATSFLTGNLPLWFEHTAALRGTATKMMSTAIYGANTHGLKWHRSMLRCKDPAASVKFYEERFGMKLVDVYHSPTLGKSNYYLASIREGEKWPEPGTAQAHERLFDMEHSCVQLEHEHGAENNSELQYSSGNDEPYRGFGHLALLTPDVYKASEELEKAGVLFKKKPDEGRMKGLAFAYDPDGYWIELVKRNEEAGHPEKYNLGQTMLRIKDVDKSLDFYTGEGGMGMTKDAPIVSFDSSMFPFQDPRGFTLFETQVCELHFDSFSLYFLQSLSPEEISSLPAADTPSAYERMGRSWAPVLELTHNHGTESDPGFSYHNGNTDTKGFGYLGFIVDDLDGASKCLRARGAKEIPEPSIYEGKLARFADPDGYHVQLARRKTVLD